MSINRDNPSSSSPKKGVNYDSAVDERRCGGASGKGKQVSGTRHYECRSRGASHLAQKADEHQQG
ncbi:MAG: hypothetical protein H6564_20855 [Lewinellaceae bacterium]|nr:hypothetical protein [Lewinellaceae bacterium]